jgi:hypothetical protein
VDVVPGVVVVVVDWVGAVVVGALLVGAGGVDAGIVTVTGIVVVVVTVIVEVVPVVVVVVMVTVVVGFTLCAEAASFEEPAVTWASPTPAAAANARPTADATTTPERRLTRGNRLGMAGIPSSGTSAYGRAVAAGGRNLRRAP